MVSDQHLLRETSFINSVEVDKGGCRLEGRAPFTLLELFLPFKEGKILKQESSLSREP
jgi:hypothetical protein